MNFINNILLTTTLIYAFCLRLRFPKGTPITTTITSRYGRNTLLSYRNVEKTSEQIIKTQNHVTFLRTCKDYNLTPKFLRFKLYNKHLHSSDHYRQYQRILLDKEIKSQVRKKNRLQQKLNEARKQLRNQISWLDNACLLHRVKIRNKQILINIQRVHSKKLRNLGYDVTKKLDPRSLVTNLSDVPLSQSQIEALAFGLKHALPPKSLNKTNYYHNFETLANMLKKRQPYGQSFKEISNALSHIASSTFYSFNNWKHTIPDSNIRKELEDLIQNKDIVITKPDKGRGVVILNKQDYVNKALEILNDESKFKKRDGDPLQIMFSLRDKMNHFLGRLLKSKKISNETYDSLYITSAKPGVLYGLPKTHKPSIPIRPILSAINTFNYKLAKFLVPILHPIATNEYTLDSTKAFTDDIKQLRYGHPIYLASFDITSLYTNIPIDETIAIAVDELCGENEVFINLEKRELKRMLELSVKDNVFYFNNTLYQQIDGCAMGSPASGTYANIFMCFHEQNWLKDCPQQFKPLYYRRFADDTFVIFREEAHVAMFSDYLNSKHPNIKFTHEVELNNQLNFLDVTVTHRNGSLSTCTYRKPTHTGLGTHFTSFIPHSFKINAIPTLLHRAYVTCSTWAAMHAEITYLFTYFQQNGFPQGLIHNAVNRFLNKLFQPTPAPITVPKESLYVPLPFLGPLSFHTRNQLSKLLSKAYPQLNIKYIFTNNFTIGSLFPYKDRIPLRLQSYVVYEYRCCCSATYVGKTTSNMGKRMAEHQGVSDRTGTERVSKLHSAIRDHAEESGHPFDLEAFKIIGSARNSASLDILEMLNIKFKRPSLNLQTATMCVCAPASLQQCNS